MAVTAAVAAVVVAAGTSGYQAHQAHVAKDDAISEKGRQEKLAEKATNDAKIEQQKQADALARTNAEADTTAAAYNLRDQQQRARRAGGGGGNKGGTVLTGPQGDLNAPYTANKTLLGQ